MQKSEFRLRIEFLGKLSDELKFMRRGLQIFNYRDEVQVYHKALELNDKLQEYWDDLDRWLPKLWYCHWLWGDHKLDRRIALIDWVADIACCFPGSLGEIWSQHTLPPPLQAVEVWSDADNLYWDDIFSCLHMWQQLTDAGLASVEWVSDTETVGIVMNWKGAFKSIESLPPQAGETGTEYWTVSYQIEGPICLAEACDALLLCAQIVSRRGGNLLTPAGLHNDYLTMKLNILRAGQPPSRPPTVPVPGKVVIRVVDVVARMPFKYAEASKQAEALLLQEIERLEPYAPQVDLVNRFLPDFRQMLDQLRLIREGLVSDTLFQHFKQADGALHLMSNPLEEPVGDQANQAGPD